MNRLPIAVAALAAAFQGVSGQSRYPIVRQETISRTLRAERLLEVSTIGGSIRVAGYDGNAVDVAVKRTVRAETEADADAAATTVALEMNETPGAVHLLGHANTQPGCDWETITRRRTRPRYDVAGPSPSLPAARPGGTRTRSRCLPTSSRAS